LGGPERSHLIHRPARDIIPPLGGADANIQEPAASWPIDKRHYALMKANKSAFTLILMRRWDAVGGYLPDAADRAEPATRRSGKLGQLQIQN
jgi:hypothetical protein